MAYDKQFSFGIPKRIGELLASAGIISSEQLSEVVEIQRRHGGKLGNILIQKKFLDEKTLLRFLSKQFGIEYVEISALEPIQEELIQKIPKNIARQHHLIPVLREGNAIVVAMEDPMNIVVLDVLKMMTGYEIKAVLASGEEIIEAIGRYYGGNLCDSAKKSEVFSDKAVGADREDAVVMQTVNIIISDAVKSRASDIHIEPCVSTLRVRFRIDGVLQPGPEISNKIQHSVIARLKVMAGLGLSESHVPQDGATRIKLDGKEISLRVSSSPCVSGEKIVIHIRDSSVFRFKIDDLGFEPENMAVVLRCLKAPHGINLITGPAGSGKTTTLYAALAAINEPGINILTIEDPVEYVLEGLNQVKVNAEAGLTLAAGLRAFLRQDADIIMAGDIQDPESMSLSVSAAMTGRLVFSSLNTNDAAGAIARISMLGIEPYLISSTLLMVVGQRLVRTICVHCRENYEVDVQLLGTIGARKGIIPDTKKVTLARGRGCLECAGTGYHGRIGIHEVLEINDAIRALIAGKAPAAHIKEAAKKHGMITLRESAVRKAMAGITTVEEVLRVTASESE